VPLRSPAIRRSLTTIGRPLALALTLALPLTADAAPAPTKSVERTVAWLPDARGPEPVEIPGDRRVTGVEVVALACDHDHAALAAPALRAGYQGFERGRRLVWLMPPDVASGAGEHATHARRVTVRLSLAPSDRRAVPRERVVSDWEARGVRPAPAPTTTARVARRSPAAEPFRPEALPSVLGSPVAYLIVTTDALVPAFQPLADWKTASGVPAAIRTLEFIRAQYPSAVDDAERIRTFVRDAYARWGTRWLLLGGDTEILPARYAHTSFLGDELHASDLYYSCLDGNWNGDGDSTWADGYAGADNPGDDADLLPEVWVGRAPVVTPDDVALFVRKSLSYQTEPDADAMERVLFFAEVIQPQNWTGGTPQFDGAQLVEQDALPILDTTPHLRVARLYENWQDVRWRPGAVRETRARVLDSLTAGYNVAVHIGHGYREVMSVGDDNLTNRDAHGLANGAALTNLYAIDCTSSAIDFASIGEAFMRAPDGGAVTSVGSTALDYPQFGRIYQKEYFRLLWQDSVTAVGEAQGRQKLPFVGSSFYDGFDRLSQLTLLLLGDPELRIYTARPRILTVTAPDSVVAGAGSVTIGVETGGAPLAGARVTVWMPDREYRSALTDDAGTLVLPFHPDTLGACSLTVTAFNARPWRGTLRVAAGAPAALHALSPAVFDDPADGRQGDGDGTPEAAESLDVAVAIRNAGGSGATGLAGTLGTTDAWITVLEPTAPYEDLAPAAVSSSARYRVAIAPDVPDDHEAAFTLDLAGDGGLAQHQTFRLRVRAPRLARGGHAVTEPSGDGDGRPEPGETVAYAFTLRNDGSGDARGLTGSLRSLDSLAQVLDSMFTLPDLPPDASAATPPLALVVSAASARLELRVIGAAGIARCDTVDLEFPSPIASLAARGGAGRVTLSWMHSAEPDLAGYRVERSDAAAGPFTAVSPDAAGATSGWVDADLAPLTRYWYRVAAVDRSGNASAPSTPVSALTGPAPHAGFPRFTRESSDTPVAVSGVGGGADLLVGGDVLHRFRADGSAPVDADGDPATPGDVGVVGRYFAGGGTFVDLDQDGGRDMVGAAWTSQQLVAWDESGALRPGFPVALREPAWSSVASGDLDGDDLPELVVATLGGDIVVVHGNGTELRDGDANPATTGVFKRIGAGFHPGTPAIADLTNTGTLAIVYGGGDGFLHAWHGDGTNLPGFPVALGAGVYGPVTVGWLDGPSALPTILVPASNNTLRAIRGNGALRPGFPVATPTAGVSHAPAPALADMNGDGVRDIVTAGTDGRIRVVDRNGAAVAPWSAASRFSPLTIEATTASPVVADLDGDGHPDVVVGDANGSLAALSGATGAMLDGFPIDLEAEAWGTPAVCD
jgi:hypothetical protein